MTYPLLRLATSKDMKALWEIWMQPHVLQYMSFEKMSFAKFKLFYKKLSTSSQIYLLVDKIKNKEIIVAVNRLIFEKGNRSHIAGYYSTAVHKDYLGKGYGAKLYDLCFKLIKKKKHIKRIEFTQSEGNMAAFGLAERQGFTVEAIFPGWLYRKDHVLYERFVSRILDKKILNPVHLAFDHIAPSLKSNNKPLPIKYKIIRGTAVLKHIAFLTIPPQNIKDLNRAADYMRKISLKLYKSDIKKIEIFTHDPVVIKLLQLLGYFYRGEKLASIKIGEAYFNETAADFSFFNLDDAKKFIKSKKLHPLLDDYKKAIAQELKAGIIDQYTACYDEYKAYQLLLEANA